MISMITLKNSAAEKKKGMTLDELASFVQEAMRQNLPGDAYPKVTVGWKMQIETLTIEGAPE